TLHTDPTDAQGLALRGYIAKTLAQIAETNGDGAGRQKYFEEAARMFEQAVKLNASDTSAYNGIGNVQYALGNLDDAVAAYKRAIDLAPENVIAYHDLALAYEAK